MDALSVAEQRVYAMGNYYDNIKFELSDFQKTLPEEKQQHYLDTYKMNRTILNILQNGPQRMTELYDSLAPHWREHKERNLIRSSIWSLMGMNLLTWNADGTFALRGDLDG